MVPGGDGQFAILDLFGRITNKSIGELIGGVTRTSVPFYVASGRRDTTPQQEIDYLKSLIDETGAKAVKYRVGGRMSRNQDASPGRTQNVDPALPQGARRQNGHSRRFEQFVRRPACDSGRPLAGGHRRGVRGALPVRRLRVDQAGH